LLPEIFYFLACLKEKLISGPSHLWHPDMDIVTKTIHVDQRFLQGLIENSSTVIREIYERFSGKVKSYILNNDGNEEDAADIFQEALVNIYQQAKDKALLLTCPFEAFLLLVCKRKWLNELKKRRSKRVTNDLEHLSNEGVDEWELSDRIVQQESKSRLFLAIFEKLGEKCKEIIRISLNGKPQEENALTLGLSYGFFRKKKTECMSTLIKLIQGHQPPSIK
jgi:RNA polymerase sigma factor (sigma-70 family)